MSRAVGLRVAGSINAGLPGRALHVKRGGGKSGAPRVLTRQRPERRESQGCRPTGGLEHGPKMVTYRIGARNLGAWWVGVDVFQWWSGCSSGGISRTAGPRPWACPLTTGERCAPPPGQGSRRFLSSWLAVGGGGCRRAIGPMYADAGASGRQPGCHLVTTTDLRRAHGSHHHFGYVPAPLTFTTGSRPSSMHSSKWRDDSM